MPARSAFVKKLRAVVLEHHSDEQFGVSELVEKFGMSRSQVHRKLKAANGKSISQFIREVRLDEALKLLRENDYTASEVSFMVGFNSPTYFNTCFHEYFGFPPGEAKHRKDSELSPSAVTGKPVKRNKRVVIWLVLVTLLVATVFVFNYAKKVRLGAVDTVDSKPKTIAVLPFKNWSGNPELEYVSDGMTDAVITRLSRISEIERVVPFSTIIKYRNSQNSPSEIARELDVAYILEGNFKLSGKNVMCNLNLIDVNSDKYLWTLEYTGLWKGDQIFEMQSDVAESVAENINIDIKSSEEDQLNFIPTKNEEAYRLYLQANHQVAKFSDQGYENAITLYEKAIERDSSFAEPYIGLGRAYFLSGLISGRMSQKAAADKVKTIMNLAKSSYIRRTARHDIHIEIYLIWTAFYYDLDIRTYEEYYQSFPMKMGIFDNESNFLDCMRKTGRFEEAAKLSDIYIETYPWDSYGYINKAIIYCLEGRKDDALALMTEHDELGQDNYYYLFESAKWYYYLDKHEKSKAQLKLFLNKYSVNPPIIIWLKAIHAEIDNNPGEVEEYLSTLNSKYENQESGSPAWFIALYYCHIKEYDHALDWLEKSYDQSEVELTWFKEEPLLRPLNQSPRYIEIYNMLGFDVIEPLETIKD